MSFVQNFPCFSIVLSMVAGIISTPMKGKNAKRVTMTVLTLVLLMSIAALCFTISTGESYTYSMGKYPAPWGNEIRVGILETLLASFFSLIMLLSLAGGMDHIFEDVKAEKQNLYFILIDLLLSSLLAIIYTNDLFTGYVFVEINTIAACGLIMISENGRALIAATRYMIMSSIGSGLLLLGLAMLYGVTGHLLMQPVHDQIVLLYQNGEYIEPVVITIAVITVGLAIKSGLYPFHSWMPDAYGHSTVSSSAILSSLVSKSYIIFLIKFFYRVVGMEAIGSSRIMNILFVLGLVGMIMGSVGAIRAKDVFRMIAFSSIAQIGYVYMGIGLGSGAGMVAAVFHILTHSATKSLLFISAKDLTDASDKRRRFEYLQGAAFRNPRSGFAFLMGSLSMVGIPMLAGFISKILFAEASLDVNPVRTLSTLIVLAISTILNAVYFFHVVIRIYTPVDIPEEVKDCRERSPMTAEFAMYLLVAINFVLGLFSQPITDLINKGLTMFG